MAKTATRPKHRIVRLHESSIGSAPDVDRKNGVIRNVKVLGTISQNGREYSEDAKRDAARILEGIHVNIDHNRENPNAERGFTDTVGTLNGLYIRPDGVYAKELRIKKSHPLANLVFESAEQFPKSFGLSINAEGEVNKRGGRWIVDSLVNPQSVDIVSRPATTKGLFESVKPESNHKVRVRPVRITIKKLVESHGSPAMRSRLKKLLEAGGGDMAALGAPVDMAGAPGSSGDDDSADEWNDGDADNAGEPDPMDQIQDAFVSLVAQVMGNDALDLKAKIAQAIQETGAFR